MPAVNVLQSLQVAGGEDRLPGGLPSLVVRRVQHVIGRQAATTTPLLFSSRDRTAERRTYRNSE